MPRLWAVQVSPAAHGWFDRTLLENVRKDGINALAVRVSALGRKAAGKRTFDAVRTFAAAQKLYLLAVLPAGKPSTPAAKHAVADCKSRRLARLGLRCAVQARSVTKAAKLARLRNSTRPFVAVYVKGPRSFSAVATLRKSLRRRIVVIAPLSRRFDASAWASAIGQTAASPSVNMAIAPTGSATGAVQQFATLLGGGSSSAASAGPDTQAPSAPSGLTASAVTQSSLSLSWNASADNVGVAGYRLFRNGTEVATSATTSFNFGGLFCGTSYSFGVAAFDAAGNVSGTVSLPRSTSACSGSGADTQAPSTPAGLAAGSVAPASLTLSWNASGDNVGVAGYRLFLNALQVGTSSSTSYSFTGLSCGTSYTFGVLAYDAAGNASGVGTLTHSTGACASDNQAPSTPTGLVTGSVTQSSLGMSWTPSSDNVGVAVYRVYLNGTQAGTSPTPAYVFGGLSCQTSYTLGVSAVDAAGNASSIATTNAQTAPCPSGAADVFVAQVSAGSGNGTSCANAEPATFFNTASNWGSGKPIAPGKVVGLCGTITTSLTAQASGSSGNPITILFQPGAKLSQPACPTNPGCLNISGLSYIVVDGGTDGTIQNTNDGSALGLSQRTVGILAKPCDHCEIRNLHIVNMYVRIANSGGNTGSFDNTGENCIQFTGTDVSIHDNVMHDASWCIFEHGAVAPADNIRIYNNDIYNVDHGYALSAGGGQTIGAHFFYDNHVHDFAIWDDPSNFAHHDGIHCYSSTGAFFPSGFYVYDNTFDGDLGSHNNTFVFMEGSAQGTPCTTSSTSRFYFFNNMLDTLATSGRPSAQAPLLDTRNTNATVFTANNSILADQPSNSDWAQGGLLACNGCTILNNVVTGFNRLVQVQGTPAVFDHNAYTNCPPALSYNCFNGTNSWTTYHASFEPASTANQTSTDYAASALGVGENLSSYCRPGGANYDPNLVPLCSDINGVPRPATGPWNDGAVG